MAARITRTLSIYWFTMSFVSPDSDEYVGKTAVCRPIYCWGWGRSDLKAPTPFEPINNAGVFTVRIDGFIEFGEKRIGVFGVITQTEHLFSDLLFEATLRQKGEFNLTDRLSNRFDIEIGPNYPDKRGRFMTEGSPIYNGCVRIALDIDFLNRFWPQEKGADG